MRPPFALLGFGAVALTLLLLQIVLSRFFAATLTYYYAFMLISLAMLGLAAGGLIVRLIPRLIPAELAWERASWLALAMGLSVFLGTLAMLSLYPEIHLDSDYEITNPWAFAALFWCTFPAFLAGGILVSGVLAAERARFHRLYAIDLASAAAGCLLALFLLETSTPVEILLGFAAVLPMLAAALFALEARRTPSALAIVVLSGAITLVGHLLTQDPARAKPVHVAFRERRELVSAWNSVSSVRVYEQGPLTWALSPLFRGPFFPTLDLIIDGLGGTPIVQFDGRKESLAAYTYLDADLTALPHHLLGSAGRQLIIGPGGGVDVLQAVRAGRSDITLVEINPVIERVVNDELKQWSGSPYRLPGVRTVIDNGRTFVKGANQRWDLMTLTWVDTGGSATALALSENYLYTVEAFEEYMDHLRPYGIVAFERAWNTGVRVDSMRGVAVAAEALRKRGVRSPKEHIVIAGAQTPYFGRPMCLVLVSPDPFSPERVAGAERFLSERGFLPVWLPGRDLPVANMPEPLREVAAILQTTLTTSDPEAFYRDAVYDIAPATDDNPFYFVERAGPRRAAGVGVKQLSLYLAILSALVVPFLLAPLVSFARQSSRLETRDVRMLGYFALLGLSFMLVEIEFFHLLALLLGKPTLTLAVVLASLLVFSGAGSLFGERLAEGKGSRVLALFGVLTFVLLLFSWFGSGMVDALVHHSLALRVLCTVLIVAPIAFCMGLPLPAGMRLIRERQDLVLWGWAINGAVSVFASLAAIYLAIHYGIGRTFAVGCAGYAAAGLLLWLEKKSQAATPQTKGTTP
jgi:hypothetical protein